MAGVGIFGLKTESSNFVSESSRSSDINGASFGDIMNGFIKDNPQERIKSALKTALEQGLITQEEYDQTLEFVETLSASDLIAPPHKNKHPRPPSSEEVKNNITTALQNGIINQTQADQLYAVLETMDSLKNKIEPIMSKLFANTDSFDHQPRPDIVNEKINLAVLQGTITESEAKNALSALETLHQLRGMMPNLERMVVKE